MNRFLVCPLPLKVLLQALLLGICLSGCRCVKPPVQVANSANVLLKVPLTDTTGLKEKIRLVINVPADSIKIKRCPCDTALINITLPNDHEFRGHDGEVAIRPKGRGEGADIDLANFGSIAINRKLSPLEESQFFTGGKRDSLRQYKFDAGQLIPIGNVLKDETKAVSIAVFDSGLNPAYLSGVSWQQSTTLCAIGSPTTPASSMQGWNFINSPVTTSTADDQEVEHGSRVAYFMAKQFGDSPVPIRIMPMKVLGRDNTGDLFSILCAMETARKNKVELFSMSLGYYGDRDTVFAEYIKRAVDQGIWIVTAAGNQPNSSEERNLSARSQSFYPAFFTNGYNRVIAVTTMNGTTVCDGQNFDQNFVIGVKDDLSCRFKLVVPGATSNIGVIGTSYATPIVAGWLGRTLREQNLTGAGVMRQQFIDKMNTSSVPGLYQGKFINRK